jgi:hypothetical protein
VLIKPAFSYPCTYQDSHSEIEFTCHEGRICGSAKRTGLTAVEEWPVYTLHSFVHPEYNDIRVALSPDGFRLLSVFTIVEQVRESPYTTPFIAQILVESAPPYDFDLHPSAPWMYTKSDLVQAVFKQVSGIRYVAPDTWKVCCALVGFGESQSVSPQEIKDDTTQG